MRHFSIFDLFFCYRVLHQQAKTNEVNAITPRHRQHSPSGQQHQYDDNSPKYNSKNSKTNMPQA